MSFEPFRSVVIPKGKMGSIFEHAPAEPAGRETRTIILEGPALGPEEAAGTAESASAPVRGTTVTRPSAVGRPSSAPSEDSEVFAIAEGFSVSSPGGSARGGTVAAPASTLSPVTPVEPEVSVAPAAPRPRGSSPERTPSSGGGSTVSAVRQYIVAYDGKLVGTYRSTKRIQNRTAYLKVAEQLVGQIEGFDPARIRLYRLTEVTLPEPIRGEELGESFHTFPRTDLPSP